MTQLQQLTAIILANVPQPHADACIAAFRDHFLAESEAAQETREDAVIAAAASQAVEQVAAETLPHSAFRIPQSPSLPSRRNPPRASLFPSPPRPRRRPPKVIGDR